MSKVNLTYSENKSLGSLTLEQKKSSMTWAESAPGTWGESTATWGNPKEFSTREAKSSVSLSLEAK